MEIISAWELYLWTRLDAVRGMLWGISLFLGVGLYGYTLGLGYCCGWYNDHTKRFLVWLVVIVMFFSFSMIARALVPTQKDMAMIYVIPKIANSETIQNEASEIYTMAKDAIKEYLPAEAPETAAE